MKRVFFKKYPDGSKEIGLKMGGMKFILELEDLKQIEEELGTAIRDYEQSENTLSAEGLVDSVKDLLDQIRKLYGSDKLEERIAADILTFDECFLHYTRNFKTKEVEVTRMNPANVRFVYTKKKEEIRLGSVEVKFTDVLDIKSIIKTFIKDFLQEFGYAILDHSGEESLDKLLDDWIPKKLYKKEETICNKEDVTFIPTPLAQRFYDNHDLWGIIRAHLRKNVEQAKDLEQVLIQDPIFSSEISLKIELPKICSDTNWDEVLSSRANTLKQDILLEYTSPDRQVISKKYSCTIETINPETGTIWVSAIESEEPAVVKGKIISSPDEIED